MSLTKPAWWYEQSGVIPYRVTQHAESGTRQLEVLLITSRKRKRWIIPKGIVEPAMTPQESAVKEAFEEAGITGQVSEKRLGVYTYPKWGGTCRVAVFLFAVTAELNDWPEADQRTREWMSLAEAVRRVEEAALKAILRQLPNYVIK
jgi:8-oxo-dGTP pyrophosphatase MutT (NUDIX family)